MKPISRRAAAVATAAAILAGLLASAPASGEPDHDALRAPDGPSVLRPIVKKKKIAPGLTFARIVEKGIPRRTFVLRMNPAKAVTLDVTLARSALPGRRTVPQISKANGALAAVNGDFTINSAGRPVHPFAQDGDLLQTSFQGGPLFSLSKDEKAAYVGTPRLRVSVSNLDGGQSWRLARWNQGSPAPGEIAGFSPTGGTIEIPPPYTCSVRLQPEGGRSLDADGTSVVADYTVAARACDAETMGRDGGVVLSAPPATDEATQLLALAIGARMRLRWTLGWAGAYDVVGGTPVLVQDGRVVATTCSSSFCRRNPRTGIGYTANGGIVLVVVDGRRSKWSVGASLGEFAQIMRNLGAVQALNLDGGGSSTMVVRGDVVNKPSDGVLRNVSNAVLVLPGPDPGER